MNWIIITISWIWDRIDIHALQGDRDFGACPGHPDDRGWPAWTYRLAIHLAREGGRLERLVGWFRPCKLCRRSHEQRYIMKYGEHWVHVDCGAEYNDSCRVDETTQLIDESDEDYAQRMAGWEKKNGYA